MWSYSKVDCYKKCPQKYNYRYVQRLPTPERDIKPDDALVLGSAIHKGLETNSVEQALHEYSKHFYIEGQLHEYEKIKIEHWISEIAYQFVDGQHELQIKHPNWTGFIDYTDDERIIDFKYSNYKSLDGTQLMLYAYLMGWKHKKLYYLYIPKTKIRQKKTETVEQFIMRLCATLNDARIDMVEVNYDQKQVDEFLNYVETIDENNTEARPSKLCEWCDYRQICYTEHSNIF